MITEAQFQKRANVLFESCRTRWRKKAQKCLPKGIKLLAIPSLDLPFSRTDFHAWLRDAIGLQAMLCGYCGAPIDILNLSLDHKTPLRRGGGPELQNLQLVCSRCNSAKGEFTHEEYLVLVSVMERDASYFRQRLEGVLINGNLGNQMRNFPRKKGGKPRNAQESLLSSNL